MSALTELSNILWRQRRTLERLLYKLEVQQLMLAAGRSRWVTTAAAEVEDTLDKMRGTELSRAVQTAAAAGELGLPTSEPSLRELIDAAPAPWDAILRDHHEAFLQMTAEVEELTRSNTELLTRGYNATRDYLNALHGATLVDAYSAKGTGETFGGTTHVIDRAF